LFKPGASCQRHITSRCLLQCVSGCVCVGRCARCFASGPLGLHQLDSAIGGLVSNMFGCWQLFCCASVPLIAWHSLAFKRLVLARAKGSATFMAKVSSPAVQVKNNRGCGEQPVFITTKFVKIPWEQIKTHTKTRSTKSRSGFPQHYVSTHMVTGIPSAPFP
jgi:hypothetical protein